VQGSNSNALNAEITLDTAIVTGKLLIQPAGDARDEGCGNEHSRKDQAE